MSKFLSYRIFFSCSDNGFGLFLNSCLIQLQRMTLESISVKPPMGLDYLRNAQWNECKLVCVKENKGGKQSCSRIYVIVWCNWELQPRFHPLSSVRAGGDQIVISTSGLNPVREMLWCHTHAHTYTRTQGLTSIRLWWHPSGFRRWRCEWRENLAVHQLPTTIYLAFLNSKYRK